MSVYRDHYAPIAGPPCPWCETPLVEFFCDDESYAHYQCVNNDCIASRDGYDFSITAKGAIICIEREVETDEGTDWIEITSWPKLKRKPKFSMKGALDRFTQSDELGQ